MSLNFTVSYTFSPSTTISSSQVNTNTSDVANVFTGLEAKTKTFSNLGIDTELKSGGTIKSADGTAAAPGITFTSNTALGLYVNGSYFDAVGLSGFRYRRPVLQYASATTVAVESGLNGTSGSIPMLFPDGSIRTETSTTRTTFNITRNAVLVTSGAQSGLTGATAEAVNTTYALYACKVTDSTTLWCTVGSTVLPIQANYATLNTAYGTNGWVYLGLVRNGDNSGATGDILEFYQAGHTTMFLNACAGAAGLNIPGIRFATTAGATSLSYSGSLGTGATDVPNVVSNAYWTGLSAAGGTGALQLRSTTNNVTYFQTVEGAVRTCHSAWIPITGGVSIIAVNSSARDIGFSGFIDGALGVGPNPLL